MTVTSPEPVMPHLAPRLQADVRNDDPRRDIVVGVAIAAVFLGGVVGWAALTRLDAAATAAGVITVSGHRQKVQPAAAGVVTALKVRDGEQVRAGQVVVELSADEVRANERSLSSRVIFGQAMIARLEAERRGATTFAPPPEFAGLTGDDKIDADRAMVTESRQLQAQILSNTTRRQVLMQSKAQAGQQIIGNERQIAANARQQTLITEELDGVKDLAARGYAPVNRVRALERTAASLQGDNGAQMAEIARLREVVGQTSLQILQGDTDRAAEVADELRKAEGDLQTAKAQLIMSREQLVRSSIKAPATGTVVGLDVNTIGGVVAAGQTLMEIVPKNGALVIDARIQPKDGEGLHAGQEVQVRFDSLHIRNLPVVHGRLTRVSADTLTDERTGQGYFSATVTVPPAEMKKITEARGATPLKPGLPVHVMVPLRKRTALQYWFEPLTQAMWGSFSEH